MSTFRQREKEPKRYPRWGTPSHPRPRQGTDAESEEEEPVPEGFYRLDAPLPPSPPEPEPADEPAVEPAPRRPGPTRLEQAIAALNEVREGVEDVAAQYDELDAADFDDEED